MTTLHDMLDDDRVPTGLAGAAQAELPSTLRTLATVGGTVATGDPDSVLVAALLVHDARVELVGPGGYEMLPLGQSAEGGGSRQPCDYCGGSRPIRRWRLCKTIHGPYSV
ncbi:MAG: hypothetical protein CM1200mP26_25850 [Acidimicrobiales bacterium]|nr:MAG: hypothetical protein CM1200mP26_25850 [Acidimicrobiales bacterium]